MERVIFELAVGFFTLLGLTSAAEWMISGIFRGGWRWPRLSIVPVSGKDGDIEQRLRCAYGSLRYDRWMPGGELIIVNLGAHPDTWAVCEAYSRGRAGVRLCAEEELAGILTGQAVYKGLVRILY